MPAHPLPVSGCSSCQPFFIGTGVFWAAVCAWFFVTGCAVTQVEARATQVEPPEDIKDFVLVIQDGDIAPAWMPASEVDWPMLGDARASPGLVGRAEFASQRQRDCDQEQIDCFSRCWQQDPPEGYRRHKREHYAYCQEECLRAYMDCLKATGQYLLEFRGMNEALDWLKRHRREIAVGSIIVAAGVAFVAVSAAGGVLILAPVVLF